MTDRLWEIAQGRFGARSMRACLESPYITIHQQVSEYTAPQTRRTDPLHSSGELQLL